MKLVSIILIGVLFLGIFTFVYTFALLKNNHGVMNYDDYYDNPPCEPKYLDDGWTQIHNCAIYKVNQSRFQRSNRVR